MDIITTAYHNKELNKDEYRDFVEFIIAWNNIHNQKPVSYAVDWSLGNYKITILNKE